VQQNDLDTGKTSQRKKDHIDLAFLSQTSERDERFYYEPMLSGHPAADAVPETQLAGKTMKLPLWVSSMTGGTEKAGLINRNLARACAEFGMGLGLGSCRIILDDETYFKDFNVRPVIGYNQPLFANLGIAQIETLLEDKQVFKISEMLKRLEADGLIVHVNPLQEWLQPEGDHIRFAPVDTIKRLLDALDCKIIVKEVGQGFGPRSFVELIGLPIEAIEFGAHGGTNFATLELHRQETQIREQLEPLIHIGHSAEEMVGFANEAIAALGEKALCQNVIISGGIKSYLDGYYLLKKASCNAVYAQASAFLKHAAGDYELLRSYCELQRKGLQTAYTFLDIKQK